MNDRFKFRAFFRKENRFIDWDEMVSDDEFREYFLDGFSDVEKIQQCTGLKDKDGTLIYEGDIDDRGFVVEYLVGMSGFYLMKNGEGSHLSHEQSVTKELQLKHIKIIGNIYQNPELLEN